jgi:hypothetical protein
MSAKSVIACVFLAGGAICGAGAVNSASPEGACGEEAYRTLHEDECYGRNMEAGVWALVALGNIAAGAILIATDSD